MIKLKFDKNGLIPVVVQDYRTNTVLMQAFMNKKKFKVCLSEKEA